MLPPTQLSFPMPGLPAGVTIYATLFTEIEGRWDLYQTITFTAAVHVANFTYPLQGMYDADPSQSVTWTTSNQDQGYYLVVGTTPGGKDLVNSGILPASQSSYKLPPLPASTLLYATIITKTNGVWERYQSITFAAAPGGQASFLSPLNGQKVLDMTAPFTWTPVPQAQGYYLVVSTVPGGANVINSGFIASPQTYFKGVALPKNVPLYGTIYTEIAGAWTLSQTIAFTAG